MSSIYDFSAKLIDGNEQAMSAFQGKAILIVNVASKCGYTPQYAGLESLYKKYKDQGLLILGFPCNQFLSQEPGDEQAIQQFCSLNYEVSFPLFAKIDVNGEHTHPIYQFLKKSAKGILGSEAVKWNFTKFLVSRDGKTVERFATATKPEEMESDIKRVLGL